MKQILSVNSALRMRWEACTPLAKNEWICWITSAKKDDTKKRRMELWKIQSMAGKRRPCCWAGCPHRIK